MTKSDQDPSNDGREKRGEGDDASESSPKRTLLGIGDRLRAARESGEQSGDGDQSSRAQKSSSGTNLNIQNPSSSESDSNDSDHLGDTPADSNRAHRRTAALSRDEAATAASGDAADTGPLSDTGPLNDTGPATSEVDPDEDDIEFLDDDAILVEEPADEMEAEATMLSDDIFPEDLEEAEDSQPDADYDVGKTEVSIGALEDTPPSRETRQQFSDAPAQVDDHSGSFPEPADTPADRPSPRHSGPKNPPTPEAGRSGMVNRGDRANTSSTEPSPDADRSSNVFPKSPTPRDESVPLGDTPESGVEQPAGDFGDEKTEVFDSPYERETVVPKLSALSGPSSGQEFLLNKTRNSIGRGNNNSVMIPDLAMSRRHSEVAKSPDGTFTLRDLQSANGTVLNGTPVEEAELVHGDRIEAGKTTFQFLHPDQADRTKDGSRRLVPAGGTQPSAPMKTSSSKNPTVADQDRTGKILNYVIIVAMAVSVVLAVPVVYLLIFDDSSSQPQQPAAEPTVPEGASQDLIALYLEGVNAVKNREWDEARERFEQVQSMDPDFERVNQQLARIKREETNARRLQEARKLADEGALAEAGDIASKIGSHSVYHEDAEALVRRSRSVDVDERYKEAVSAFGDDDYDTAKKHVEAVLAKVPEHQGATELREKIEEAITEKEEAKAEEEQERKHASRATPTVRSATTEDDSNDGLFDLDGDWSGGSSSNSGSSSSADADLSKGYRLYKNRNFSTAAAFFSSRARKLSGSDQSKAQSAASNVRAFEAAYERATTAYSSGDYDSAISNYGKARKLDKKVSGEGHFQSRLSNELANSYGKRGLEQLRQGRYSNAYSSYRSGKRYGSSNSTLRSLRKQLADKARSLYIQAANKKKSNPDKARSLCDTITSMLPPSDPTYQKAKKLLGEL